MPIAGMRVRSSRTRKKEKNSPAIILTVLIVGQCDYCASGAGGRIAGEWTNAQPSQDSLRRAVFWTDNSSPRSQVDERLPEY